MEIRTREYERFDIRVMAVGCLHLLLDKAILDFPGSTRAHPSRWVVVNLTQSGPLQPSHLGYFPYKVIWYVWQEVVVPVLEDPTLQIVSQSTSSLRVALNQALVGLNNYDALVSKIEVALVAKLKETGMIHPDADVEHVEGTLEAVPAPGEPIELPETDPLDTGDDLVWPEGHPKLTYPIVDGGT